MTRVAGTAFFNGKSGMHWKRFKRLQYEVTQKREGKIFHDNLFEIIEAICRALPGPVI